MCETAAADGVTHIVATPHCNDRYDFDRAAALAMVEELAHRVPQIAFSLGCDFNLSYDNVKDAIRHPARYTIGETKYLLVELSPYAAPNSMTTVLWELIKSGMVPIVTHPERNSLLERRPDLLEEWIRIGCLVQITANSLTGAWGSAPKKFCERLLKNKQVHVVASDAHNANRRPPILSAARKVVSKLVGEEYARAFFFDNPLAIVSGQAVQLLE